jgi:hypothetical protein
MRRNVAKRPPGLLAPRLNYYQGRLDVSIGKTSPEDAQPLVLTPVVVPGPVLGRGFGRRGAGDGLGRASRFNQAGPRAFW